jgi:hypothetical protein
MRQENVREVSGDGTIGSLSRGCRLIITNIVTVLVVYLHLVC